MEKKYNIWTAISMVVGIVIGSGVFFKGSSILIETNQNLVQALLAWLITGLIMIFGTLTFGFISNNSGGKIHNLVDFIKYTVGDKYAYFVGFFFSVFYYPLLAAVLAWVTADYITSFFRLTDIVLFDIPIVWFIALTIIILVFLFNYLAPKIAGVFQVSTTLVKLVPIAIIAIGGLIYGLVTGQTFESLQVTTVAGEGRGIFYAILATAFAYEGWIMATTIGHELKDANKNLPKALFIGSVVVLVSYVLFYLGLSSVLSNQEVINEGSLATSGALTRLLGAGFGNFFLVFVIISCLGTTNGLIMGSGRAFYSLAVNKIGFKEKSVFKNLNKKTGTPTASNVVAIVLTITCLFIWFGNFNLWGDKVFIDISELPIALVYLFYIPMYIWYIKNNKEKSILRRFIIPVLALAGAIFIFSAGFTKDAFIPFAIISISTILLLALFNGVFKNHKN